MIGIPVASLDAVGVVASKEDIFRGSFPVRCRLLLPSAGFPHSVAPPDQCSDQEEVVPLRLNSEDSRTVNQAHLPPLPSESSSAAQEPRAAARSHRRAFSFPRKEVGL